MARAVENDWGFNDIARKFERDERPAERRTKRSYGKQAAKTFRFGLWFAVIALALIGLVALNVALMGKNLEHSSLVRDKKNLEAENARLASEVSTLSAPARIEKLAVEKLSMVAPTDVEYVYVDPSNTRQYYANLDSPEGAASGGVREP